MSPGRNLSRLLAYFVEPRAGARPGPASVARAAPAPAAARGPACAAEGAPRRPATRQPLRAAVLGTAAEAVPLGAVLAGALRSAAGAPAAALAVWVPAGSAPRRAPCSLAAARLARRLTARGLPAAGRGRLGWLALDDHPVAAAVAARRTAGALEVPVVVVLAGPRCAAVEGLLADQDLVVVASADPGGPLARLAVAGCAAPALACAPPRSGPERWLARTGAAGPRALPAPLRTLVRDLAGDPAATEPEAAW